MSIAKRDDGRWRARYRDAAGKEHARNFARKVDAQRWLDDVTSSVVTGTYTDPRTSSVTLKDWSATWLKGQVHLKATGRTRVEGIVRLYIVHRAAVGDDTATGRLTRRCTDLGDRAPVG